MEPSGKRGRRTLLALLIACYGLSGLALPAVGASQRPASISGKKCKGKHGGPRTRCRGRNRARLSISPPGHDFGTIGTVDSAPFDFAVTNIGRRSSGSPSVSLSGLGVAYFRINANGCAAPLAPVSSCTVTVQSVDNGGGTGTAQLDVSAAPGGAVSAPLIVNLY